MEARNINKKNQERGKTLKDELESVRSATAGVIVQAKEHHKLDLNNYYSYLYLLNNRH